MRRLLGLALAAATVLAGVLVPAVVTAPAAAAYPSATISLTGHGFGHGRGMGQYGAYGYARDLGWTYQQIIGHFYGGTTLATVGSPNMTVRLTAQDGQSLGPITAGRDFTAGGVRVPAGQAATISRQGNGFVLSTRTSCSAAPSAPIAVSRGDIQPPAFFASSDTTKQLQFCGGSRYRGSLALVPADGSLRTVNTVALDDYLRGVVPRESPSGWGDTGGQAALEAQAVAARSYSLAQNRYSYAKTCDTQSCQVYGGSGLETRQAEAAIVTTTGKAVVNGAGRVVSTEFSSSTGGYSAGGTFPAVRDDGDTRSPNHDWSATVSVATAERAFGVGTLQDIRVTRRNGLGADGGRVLQAEVIGSDRTVEVTGNQVRTALGLKSDWFSVTPPTPSEPTPAPAPEPPAAPAPSPSAAGPSIQLSNGYPTPLVGTVAFGRPGDVPLLCDWDGDGTDTVGVVRAGQWHLRNDNRAGNAQISFSFGKPTDTPVCGDWDGNGTDTAGVVRSTTFFLSNRLASGPADRSLAFGVPTDTPIVGDWDGNGTDTPGVARAAGAKQFHVTNSTTNPRTAASFYFGREDDEVVTGDWDGDRRDTVGVFRRGSVFLTNSITRPTAARSYTLGGSQDAPLAANLDAGTQDSVSVARNY